MVLLCVFLRLDSRRQLKADRHRAPGEARPDGWDARDGGR